STLLGTLGADVRIAMSAGQALEIVDRWKPDIVVTDIGMPGDDGYALLRKLRSRPGDVALVPVVALTAYATAEDRVKLLSAGFQTHVTKPVDPIELVTVVANMSRGPSPSDGPRVHLYKPHG